MALKRISKVQVVDSSCQGCCRIITLNPREHYAQQGSGLNSFFSKRSHRGYQTLYSVSKTRSKSYEIAIEGSSSTRSTTC